MKIVKNCKNKLIKTKAMIQGEELAAWPNIGIGIIREELVNTLVP